MGGPAERGQTFMPRKPLKGLARLPGRALRQACPDTNGVRLYAPCSACADRYRRNGLKGRPLACQRLTAAPEAVVPADSARAAARALDQECPVVRDGSRRSSLN